MEEKQSPAEVVGAEERERRWSTLPERVRLEDTVEVQPSEAPPGLPDPQDVERIRAMRYGAGA